MNFSLSEEQEMFRNYVKQHLDDLGQTVIARDYINKNKDTFHRAVNGLVELGVTAINVPETYGGLGLGFVDLIPVLEEIGSSVLPGVYLETTAFAVPLIAKYGSDEQKERYLQDIVAGKMTVSLAWLEPGKHYQTESLSMLAQQEGHSLIISGTKTLVPSEDNTNLFIVIVKTKKENQAGLSLVMIERDMFTKIKEIDCLDETKSLIEFSLNEVEIPLTNVLGEVNQGEQLLEEGLLNINASLSSMMVGAMDTIVTTINEYAKIRKQFGQPIGRFQAVKHSIVNMKLDLEMSRSLSYYANWALDHETEDRVAAVYSARTFITEAYNQMTAKNIQLHGGIGFTEEMDCHLYVKRAKYYESYLGSKEDYREKLAFSLDLVPS